MTKFSAFISHKTEDQSIAQALKLALETLSKHKMIVHHSGEVATGDVWRKWIDDRVLESQVLIFLYTTMERNRGWRWCFFEIGMFRGNKMLGEETSNQNIYCIKHPEIPEPPSPIEHIQVCNADEKSLSELFRQLIYSKGVFSSEALVEDPLITEGDVAKFNKEVKKVVKAFTPPVQVSFFEKRLEINLSKIVEDEIVESSINDAELSGNESTMRFLNIQEGTKWQKLYGKFQAWGEHTWLDQVRDSIDRIKRQEDPIDVLHPFKMPNGKTYIPVVTRSETFPVTDDDQKEIIIPKQLCVIFTHMPEIKPAAHTLIDMRDLVDKWVNYPPTSVVKIKWKQRRGIEYHPDDIIDEPYVCAANPEFARLWNFTYSDFFSNLNQDSNLRLTDSILMKFVEDYIDPDHLEKFKADQERLATRIIFQSKDGLATIPMQFNDNHHDVQYKNQAYLPYLISKHKIGDDAGPHEMYLLVCYVRDFLPLTDEDNIGSSK